ncbi:Capsule assembly protein Wzi [Parapedobacter indicus]|uniref:Capsule assembly protein Wzi n=2 Tax=Parapedobacter indicus TaxID=1477437 RepID=A0A1I3N035_9SPHI|nr:capsule assembly protein Wzi [Parapedobacter indicus]SFJ02599.1 Capsule assembly protein Wzi [Parapedobacter indicus]
MTKQAIPHLTSLIYFLIVAGIHIVFAQSLPVGTPGLEDRYRRDQLLGKLDSSISFSVRPLNTKALLKSNSYDGDRIFSVNDRHPNRDNGLYLELLPINWQHQITSGFPYGWNDGSMIPNVGYQTQFSAGVYAEYKFFSIQLRPEFVYAQNQYYVGFDGKTKPSWDVWYAYYNNIDMPEHFGDGPYTKLFPGQSSIRFNYGALSAGLSTENIWWGPGIRNSLLMSNTAPGFLHATLNTTHPIHTNIGSFEGQFIVGKLKGSGFTPTKQGIANHYDEYYIPKPDTWRYISGLTMVWQPKWLHGLSMGFAQSFVVNRSDQGSGIADYLSLPFIGYTSHYNKENPEKTGTDEQLRKRDAYISFFGRWVMPKGNAEIYVEYGRNDLPWDNRDFMVEIENSRAYTVGFRKLVPFNRAREEYVQIGLEATQTEKSRTLQVRDGNSWYIHPVVRHGYTHRGQLLGAGIGPGSNVQTVYVSWLRGLKQIGIQVERLVHLNDFYYSASQDIRGNWVDLGFSALTEWDYKHFVFNAKVHYAHSYNYQYELIPHPDQAQDPDKYWWSFTPVDKNPFQLSIGAMYRF